MSVDLSTVTPDTTIEVATELMLEGGMRHLPVVETVGGHRKVVGMISVRDLLAASLRPGVGLTGQTTAYGSSRAIRHATWPAGHTDAMSGIVVTSLRPL
ncbi:MAG: CBS domain-containing protein [Acidimicrobiales bacterium]